MKASWSICSAAIPKMRVIQAEDLMQVRTNHVYMIPPNWDLAIQSGALRLTKPQQRRGMRMPIDFFFNSLAEDQRERAICIILSGTGSERYQRRGGVVSAHL
jgi:two-component system CheB/CheR fusion protein